MSRARAWEIVGGLSRPSKMPCYSWGIPAQTCITGGKLAEIQGSICQQCYALKGFYRQQKVQAAYQRRLNRFENPQWVEAMVKLVYWQAAEVGSPYFRWFDSGDLQSGTMLQEICAVAAATPEIWHWLPTREYRIVEEYLETATIPANLVIRLSAHLVDRPAPQLRALPTSSVHSSAETAQGMACSAYSSKPAQCGECRACWDEKIQNISYPLH